MLIKIIWGEQKRMTKMNDVKLNVNRDGKAVVFSDAQGKVLLKVHMSTEKAAQRKLDLILESQK